jgi:hypothetical protein
MSKLVTKTHSYDDILKGSMAQTQNKNQKNPTTISWSNANPSMKFQ